MDEQKVSEKICKIMSVAELIAQPHSTREEIAELLEVSAALVRAGLENNAVWRVADAALMLRNLVERTPEGRKLTATRTGRGASLPKGRR